MTITLNGRDLTVTQVVAAAGPGETVALAPEALAAMRRSRVIVHDVLAGGEPVYGLTTGVGERKAYLLDPAERQRFNHRLVLNQRIAQGDAAPADLVRGAMLGLANSYAMGRPTWSPPSTWSPRAISPRPLDPPRPAVTMTACSLCESVQAPSVTAPVTVRARHASRPARPLPAREISAVRPGRMRRPLASGLTGPAPVAPPTTC